MSASPEPRPVATDASTAGSGRRRIHWLVLAAILLASLLARLPFTEVSLIRDEGEYALAGQRILRGELPYVDVYNQKTPFAFYFMAAVQSVASSSLAGIRVATALYGLLATVLVYLTGARLLTRAAAPWAALAFAVMTFDQAGVLHPTSTEFLMLPWVALTVLCWYEGRRNRSGWRLAVAGAAAAVAVQTKQTALVVVVFLAAESLWTWGVEDRSRPRSLAVAGRDLLRVLWGFLGVTAAVVGYFAARGGLSAYVACTLTHNRQYVASRWNEPGWLWELSRRVLVEVAGVDLLLWGAGAAGLALLAVSGRERAARGLWLLLAGFAAASLLTGGSYRHYYLPLIVPLALGCGHLFGECMRWLRSGRRAAVRLTALALLVAPWSLPLLHHYSLLTMSPAEYRRTLAVTAIPPTDLSRQIGDYLRSRTSREDTILVVGSEPQIYFWARREPATRLVITYPLIAPYDHSADLRREFLDDLETRRPRYVVLVSLASSLSEFPEAIEPFLEQVLRRLDRRYAVDARFGKAPGRDALVTVFRRLDSRPRLRRLP